MSEHTMKTVAAMAAKALIIGALFLLTAATGLAFTLSGALADPADPVMIFLLLALLGASSLVLIAMYRRDWRVWCLGLITLAVPSAVWTLFLGHF